MKLISSNRLNWIVNNIEDEDINSNLDVIAMDRKIQVIDELFGFR